MNFFQKGSDFIRNIITGVTTLIKNVIENLIELAFKLIFIFIIVSIIYLIVIFTVSSKYSSTLKGTCIEADEFGAKKNIIRAKPLSSNDYYLNKGYKHNEFTQKIKQTDLNLTLNGDPIAINIVGQWIPWFGDLDEREQKKYNPDNNFFCALEKYTMSDGKYKFSDKSEENEFYYIKNYYSEISILPKENKEENTDKKDKEQKDGNNIVVQGIEEPPERQKECWITRGAGLYLGVFGFNGRTEPSAYHHVMADKFICNKVHWFGGNAKNDNYVITEYNDGSGKKQKYTLGDFKKNYFSISYYLDPNNPNIYDDEEDKNILTETENQIIYNINTHEKLLRERLTGNPSYGLIVAQSIAKFNQACYRISRGVDGQKTRSYNAYFRFGPKVLYKNLKDCQNAKYDYGEKAKMLIVDKFYNNNQGFYRIEIISGIEFDDANYIEKKIKEVEFYLLGTPNLKDSSKNRSDGMIARIFNNILSSKFILFSRAVLVLYVVIYGFRIIFGFKKDRNDRSVINRKDLMVTLFKFVIIATITSPIAYNFFSETILNFVINGTIGIVDMIAGSLPNSFLDTPIGLAGGLQYANRTASLSRNFAIVDEILNIFADKTVFSKVVAFFFNLNETFGFGLIIAISLLLVLILYLYKLIQAIIPFIFVLLQFTLVLPLAPLFLLFGLFKETSFIMQNWLKFIFSKCLELIGFFTAFYFCTSIIDNFIKKLLNYKVCFKGLGDLIFPEIDESTKNIFKIANNEIKKLVKDFLNKSLAVVMDGLPVSGLDIFAYYSINILITITLVFMFDIITKDIMTLFGSILTIDGATANVGGGDSAMKDGMGGKLNLSNQFQSFNKTMGFAEIQKTSDHLSWTRGVINLEKGIGENMMNNVKTVTRFSGNLVSAGANLGVAGLKGLGNTVTGAVTGKKYFDTDSNLYLAGKGLYDGFTGLAKSLTSFEEKDENGNPVRKSLFGKDSIIDLETILGRYIKDPELNKKEKQKSLLDSANNSLAAKDDKFSCVSDLLNTKDNASFKKNLKNMSEEKIREIFSEEIANKILSGDELDDTTVNKLRDYLESYREKGYDKSKMEDNNTNIETNEINKPNKPNKEEYDHDSKKERKKKFIDKIKEENPEKLAENIEEILNEDDGEEVVDDIIREELASDSDESKSMSKKALAQVRKQALVHKLNKNKNDLSKISKVIEKVFEEEDGENVVKEIMGKRFVERMKLKAHGKSIQLGENDIIQIHEKILTYKLSQAKGDKEKLTKAIGETLGQDGGEEAVETVLGKELVERIKQKAPDKSIELGKNDIIQIREEVLFNRLNTAKGEPEKISKIFEETSEEITKKVFGEKLDTEIRKKIKQNEPLKKEDIIQIHEKILTYKLSQAKGDKEKLTKAIGETLGQDGGEEAVETVLGKELVERIKQNESLEKDDIIQIHEKILTYKLSQAKGDKEKLTKVIGETLGQDGGEEAVETVLGKELVERIKQNEPLKKEDIIQIHEKILTYKLNQVGNKPEEVAEIIKETLAQENGDKIVENIVKEKSVSDVIVIQAREQLLVHKLDAVKDKPEEVAGILGKTDDNIIGEVFGEKNAEQLIKVKNGDLEMTNDDMCNMKHYMKKLEEGEPISDSVNHDIFSDDYGREKKYIFADKLSEKVPEDAEEKKHFIETIREQLKEVDENTVKEVFGEANVDLVKNIKDNQDYEITDDNLRTLTDATNHFKEDTPELTINEPDDKPDVICEISEGEHKYNVKTIKSAKEDKSDNVDVMAIFDQDGTVLFEIEGSDCIISSGDTKYIISSGENADVIITAYKGGDNNGVVIDKKEIVAQKVEAKMAKYKKMMEEAKKYEESQKNNVPDKK